MVLYPAGESMLTNDSCTLICYLNILSGCKLSIPVAHHSLFSPLRYHGWMQDPVLRFQTGSEPLSLEQEYAMQQKWLTDKDSKLTNIKMLLYTSQVKVKILLYWLIDY